MAKTACILKFADDIGELIASIEAITGEPAKGYKLGAHGGTLMEIETQGFEFKDKKEDARKLSNLGNQFGKVESVIFIERD